jgi:hypothetical protein
MRRKIIWIRAQVLQHLKRPRDFRTSASVNLIILAFPRCQHVASLLLIHLNLFGPHTMNQRWLIGMIHLSRCSLRIELRSFIQLGGCQSACPKMCPIQKLFHHPLSSDQMANQLSDNGRRLHQLSSRIKTHPLLIPSQKRTMSITIFLAPCQKHRSFHPTAAKRRAWH